MVCHIHNFSPISGLTSLHLEHSGTDDPLTRKFSQDSQNKTAMGDPLISGMDLSISITPSQDSDSPQKILNQTDLNGQISQGTPKTCVAMVKTNRVSSLEWSDVFYSVPLPRSRGISLP